MWVPAPARAVTSASTRAPRRAAARAREKREVGDNIVALVGSITPHKFKIRPSRRRHLFPFYTSMFVGVCFQFTQQFALLLQPKFECSIFGFGSA